MPSFVISNKCDGCKAEDRTACMHVCPNDLMALDKDKMKAYNRAPDMCWECYNCVKMCPNQAIEIRGYADFMPLGGVVQPMRSSDAIMWSVKFRNGELKRFRFKTRTIPEGTAVPDGGFDTGSDDLKSPLLRTEPQSTGMDDLSKL